MKNNRKVNLSTCIYTIDQGNNSTCSIIHLVDLRRQKRSHIYPQDH